MRLYQETSVQQYGWMRRLTASLFRNDSECYLATSLYRSVDVSRLSLIRALSKRGVMCPFWDAIDTPALLEAS